MTAISRDALTALRVVECCNSLHLDSIGLDCEPPVLAVMDENNCTLCTLDIDHWPAEIEGPAAIAAYDALCDWAERWGLATKRQQHLPGCDTWT